MFAIRWPIVWLIFRRELRDQLRDRRTLFMIFVLPILLYPILGIGITSLATAFEQKPRLIIVLGAEALPAVPPLLNKARTSFDAALLDSPEDARLLQVRVEPSDSDWARPAAVRERLRTHRADVVVKFPADL